MRKYWYASAIGIGVLAAVGSAAAYGWLEPSAVMYRCAGIACSAAVRYAAIVHGTDGTPQPSGAMSPACPKCAPVVFSDLQSPAELRRTLEQYRQTFEKESGIDQLLRVDGALEESEPHHAVMPLIPEDQPTRADVTPPSPPNEAVAAEMDLAQMWLALFGDFPKKNPKDQPATPAAGTGGSEESELVHPGRPASCQEDPSYDRQYPACPYISPLQRKNTPAVPLHMQPSEDSKNRGSDPLGAREEVPVHHEVDTMEFRPTDALDGEFAPHPL